MVSISNITVECKPWKSS